MHTQHTRTASSFIHVNRVYQTGIFNVMSLHLTNITLIKSKTQEYILDDIMQ